MSRGPVCQLYTGTIWYFTDPRPEDVRFADFQALTQLPRYAGNSSAGMLMVAQHGVMAARLLQSWGCDPIVCLGGLLHDPEHVPPHDLNGPMVRWFEAEERKMRALTGTDWECPLLRIRRMGERAVWTAMGVWTVLSCPMLSEPIWKADKVLLATEARDIMAASDYDWGPLPEPLPEPIEIWDSDRAWHEFQKAFDEFGGMRR